MWELEKISNVLKYRMMKSELGLDNKPPYLFCVMDYYQKRDLYSEAKKVGFKPLYSMKHTSVKVLMKRTSSIKIEIDKFKTNTIDLEQFWYLCRNLF